MKGAHVHDAAQLPQRQLPTKIGIDVVCHAAELSPGQAAQDQRRSRERPVRAFIAGGSQ